MIQNIGFFKMFDPRLYFRILFCILGKTLRSPPVCQVCIFRICVLKIYCYCHDQIIYSASLCGFIPYRNLNWRKEFQFRGFTDGPIWTEP